MKSANSQVFRCFLKVLSPIHIGCDDVYEPMGFVVDEAAEQMIVFDPLRFMAGLKPEEQAVFVDICIKGSVASILEIYKFLRNKSADGRRVSVCKGFIAHYRNTLSITGGDERRIKNELNRFTIDRTAYQPVDQRPFIPGTAVKGALRTAYLNAMAGLNKTQTPRGRFAGKELEKTLMGGAFQTDPFRLVKVSDFAPVGHVQTRVVYAVNEKKKQSEYDARGPYQILEVIEPGAVFSGAVTVEQPQLGAGVRNPVKLVNLLKSAALFYEKEKKRENSELKTIGAQTAGAMSEHGLTCLRVGRHSGAESVTIEGHRRIRIMKGRGEKPEFTDRATTLWLASDQAKAPSVKSGLAPFGWVEMGELTAEIEKLHVEAEAARLAAEQASQQTQGRNESSEGVAQKGFEEEREVIRLSPLEVLLKDLSVIEDNDMGRLGSIVQKMETLEDDADKGALAKAVLGKMSGKKLKKYKNRAYLEELVRKAGL